jgi:hypothetical protein
MKNYTLFTLSLVVLILAQVFCQAQISYKLAKHPTSGIYQFSIISKKTYSSPFNAISTAQVTFKVLANKGFSFKNFIPANAEDSWTQNPVVHNTKLAPLYDYYSLTLQHIGTTNYPLVANKEVLLFSFQNGGLQDCTVELIDSLDVLAKSVAITKINIGNQISILGEHHGTQNMYLGNYDAGVSLESLLFIHKVYPNPASEKLAVEWENQLGNNAVGDEISLYITEGISGLLIKKEVLSNVALGTNKTSLSLDGILSGEYVLYLQLGNYKSQGIHFSISR